MDTNAEPLKGVIRLEDIPVAIKIEVPSKTIDNVLAAIAKLRDHPIPTVLITNNEGKTMMGRGILVAPPGAGDYAYCLEGMKVSPGGGRFYKNGDYRFKPEDIKALYIIL